MTRVSCLLIGLAAASLAILYAWQRSDEIAGEGRSDFLGEELVALILPIALLAVLAAAAGVAAWMVHSRGLDETYRALDTASRIHREAEVAVSARGLVHSFEEKLNSTHRAFTLLLWFGRTLFLVSLGLFVIALLNAVFRGVDVYTAVLGGSSLVGVVVGFLSKVPERVKSDLEDVVQIQVIVTGFHRQVSLLESHAFDEEHATHPDPARALEAQTRIDQAVQGAAERIARVDGRAQAERESTPPSENGGARGGDGPAPVRDERQNAEIVVERAGDESA